MSDGPHNFPIMTDEDLARLEVDPHLIPFAVSTAQRAERSSSGEPQLTPTEAENLVEILDRVVSSDTVNPSLKTRCFKVLRKVSPAHGILPKSYQLAVVTLTDDGTPYTSGRFADIWKGQLDGRQVCVKAVRTQTAANLGKIKRRFYREIIGWKYIAHQNLIPFFGVSESMFPFCIISPWLPNGNIVEYIRKNRGVNRLQLLAQAACGLEYLHSLGVVHSGINPGNILIDDDGVACLGDLGISAVMTDRTVVEQSGTTTCASGVARYVAPELLNPSQFNLRNNNPTKESDVYSLAVTTYEVLTDIVPYGRNNSDAIIILSVVGGERPPRQVNCQWLRAQIWEMITRCWSEQRELRWDIRTVLHQLSVSSIQGVAGCQRDVHTITPSLDIENSSPPRQGTIWGQSSFFVEEPSPQDSSTRPRASNKAATRGGSGRSRPMPLLSVPKAVKKRFMVPFPSTVPNLEGSENPCTPQMPGTNKLSFSKRVRQASKDFMEIFRLKKSSRTDPYSSG